MTTPTAARRRRTPEERVRLIEIAPSRPVPTIIDDVRAGMLAPPRSLPPKYFYDRVGSELFDRICDTPEYYPTRTEAELLSRHAREIVAIAQPRELVELGAGTMRKTRYLLDAAAADGVLRSYAPFDISIDALHETGRRVTADYHWLEVNLLAGDYHAGLANLPGGEAPRLFVFLGGTIGNFEAGEAAGFLAELARCMNGGDHLVIGFDRLKDPAVLHAAYNDSAGMTARFNRNVLAVLNRELDADFDPPAFRHDAVFAAPESRIEMYLVAEAAQRVRLGALDQHINIAAGERILTEISRKFTVDALTGLLHAAGFALVRHFSPADDYYSLVLAKPANA